MLQNQIFDQVCASKNKFKCKYLRKTNIVYGSFHTNYKKKIRFTNIQIYYFGSLEGESLWGFCTLQNPKLD